MSTDDDRLIDRLLKIEEEIEELMNTGLKGGKVDLKKVDQLQSEVRDLRMQLQDKPELMKKYNERNL